MGFLLFLLLGCPKVEVERAPSPEPVTVALPLALDEGVVAAPDGLLARISSEITRRNLTPRPVSQVGELLGSRRGTRARIELLEGPVVLLVESTARFSSQMNGRYRWSVTAVTTLSEAGREPITEEITVPVHLIYDRQREAEALEEASPVIARTVGRLLDDWLASRDSQR